MIPQAMRALNKTQPTVFLA